MLVHEEAVQLVGTGEFFVLIVLAAADEGDVAIAVAADAIAVVVDAVVAIVAIVDLS